MAMVTQELEKPVPVVPPQWVTAMRRFTDWVSKDCLGGPRPWKLAWVINFQKGGTFPFYLLLVWVYQNTSTPVLVYVALQGSYGLAWLMKDLAFPDKSWQIKITIMGGHQFLCERPGPVLGVWLPVDFENLVPRIPAAGVAVALLVCQSFDLWSGRHDRG